MTTKRTLYYEVRISFGLASLLPLLLLPAYTILGGIIWLSNDQVPPYDDVVRAFAYLLTVAGGLCAAHLMSIERETGFDELRHSYPESPVRLAALRTVTALGFILTSGIVAALMFFLLYGEYDVMDVLLPALPGAFYLCGLAMLTNNVTGSYWVAAAVVAAYWYGDFTSGGYYTGMFYLFNHIAPASDLQPALNCVALLAGAAVLFVLNAMYSHFRRRGGG